MPTHRADVVTLFGKYLPQLGVQSDLVTMTRGGDVPWGGGKVLGEEEPAERTRRHWRKLLNDLRWLGAISRYDLVMVRDKPVFILIALIWAKLSGVSCAYWMSYPFPEEWMEFARLHGRSLGWVRWAVVSMRARLAAFILYRIALPRCDHVFLQSEAMVRDMAARGVRIRRPVAVPMGVDADAIEAHPRLTPQQEAWRERIARHETIVYFGILDQVRRVDLLLRAFAIVAAQRPDALLVLCGSSHEPEDAEALRRLADELGLADRVLFTGWLAADTVWEFSRVARVGLSVLPRSNLFDVASPTKAVEYMALGLPVVANDQPDQAYVLSESGGGVCTTQEPEDVAAAIVRLLADPALGQELGARGRRWVYAHRSYRQLGQLVHDALRPHLRAAATARPSS